MQWLEITNHKWTTTMCSNLLAVARSVAYGAAYAPTIVELSRDVTGVSDRESHAPVDNYHETLICIGD